MPITVGINQGIRLDRMNRGSPSLVAGGRVLENGQQRVIEAGQKRVIE